MRSIVTAIVVLIVTLVYPVLMMLLISIDKEIGQQLKTPDELNRMLDEGSEGLAEFKRADR